MNDKKLVCSKCGATATHSKDGEKPTQTLGTWRCPTHGKVPVKRG